MEKQWDAYYAWGVFAKQIEKAVSEANKAADEGNAYIVKEKIKLANYLVDSMNLYIEFMRPVDKLAEEIGEKREYRFLFRYSFHPRPCD